MNKILMLLITGSLMSSFISCSNSMKTKVEHQKNENTYLAFKAQTPPEIDGLLNEDCWKSAIWYTLNQVWLGTAFSPDDFQGRYCIAWDDSLLYLFLEIIDDSLTNFYSNPLIQYWDDDCVEVFIDEDHSGGNHQFNHQAFAYHISPIMDAIDIGPDKQAHYYNHHIKGAIKQNKTKYSWELAIRIFGNEYSDSTDDNRLLTLTNNKIMGFSLAYCDNDSSEFRENFIGSVNSPGHYKNDGWIDASCFGKLVLVK
ncbi:MAG: sugar-binding protein [Salinivirgaceae bacterium]